MAFLDHHASDPFRLLVESVVEYAIFMLDTAGRVASWNGTAERIFGYTEAEIIGSHFSRFFTQEDVASGKPESVLKHATESSYVHEAQRVRKDGSLFWSVTTLSSIKDFFGNHAGFAEVTRDITEQKNAREAIIRERDLSGAILDSLPGVYYMYDETGHFLLWNGRFEEVTEYSASEIDKLHPLDLFQGEDKRLLAERIADVFRNGSAEVEALIVSKTGKCTPYYFNGVRAKIEGQTCLLGMGVDITKRRRSEEALRATDQRFRQAAAAANVGLWDWDLVSNEVYFSPEWKKQIGYAEDEIGHSFKEWQDRVHPDDLPGALEQIRVFVADPVNNRYDSEFRFRHRDGSYRWILSQGALLYDDLKVPVRMLGSHVDVTDQRQARKMEALGQLAAGVAHDFKNILMAINGYTEMLLQELPPGNTHGYAQEIRQTSKQAEILIQQLLTFSRRQTARAEVFDINNIIINAAKMMERLLGGHITLKMDLSPELHSVRVEENQILQILINLLVNARDAMPEGGSIEIRTQNRLLAREQGNSLSLPTGEYVVMEVSDTGCGMDEATQLKIFEPFFTTKPAGSGTGLGLATIHNIVRQLHGHVAVVSATGRGATFRVFLPVFQDTLENQTLLGKATGGAA